MHLYGQPFGGVLEKKIFYFLVFFLGKKNAKKNNNNVFDDKWFLSKMFSQIKMQAAKNGLATLKTSSI